MGKFFSVFTVITAYCTVQFLVLQKSEVMTFDQLLIEVNRALPRFVSSVKSEPISERTLRYWMSKGVLSRRVSRGPKTTYPESFIWRVILTRQYQLFSAKTLDEIADLLAKIDDDEVFERVTAFDDSYKYHQFQPDDRRDMRTLANQSKAHMPDNKDKVLDGEKTLDVSSAKIIGDITSRMEDMKFRLERSLQIQDEIIRQIDGSARQNHEVVSHQYERQLEQIERTSVMISGVFEKIQDQLESNSMRFASSIADVQDAIARLVKSLDETRSEVSQLALLVETKKGQE